MKSGARDMISGKKANDSRLSAPDVNKKKAEMERVWLADNAEAIDAENDFIEKRGLPLAKHRLF